MVEVSRPFRGRFSFRFESRSEAELSEAQFQP